MCAGHLDLADLHVQGRRWRFQGIEFAFFLTYPGGQALKITAKVIPLDFHHFHGFNTKINQIKLKSSISTKNSKTIFPPILHQVKGLGDIHVSFRAENVWAGESYVLDVSCLSEPSLPVSWGNGCWRRQRLCYLVSRAALWMQFCAKFEGCEPTWSSSAQKQLPSELRVGNSPRTAFGVWSFDRLPLLLAGGATETLYTEVIW